jgi:hypothetical protein
MNSYTFVLVLVVVTVHAVQATDPGISVCNPLGALTATGRSRKFYTQLDKTFRVDPEIAKWQYTQSKELFNKILVVLRQRLAQTVGYFWQDSEGQNVRPFSLSVLKGKRPVVLEDGPGEEDVLSACGKVEGELPSPVKDEDYAQMKLLFARLKVDGSFVAQKVASTGKYLTSLYNSKRVLKVFDDPTAWSSLKSKFLMIDKEAGYQEAPSSGKSKFICIVKNYMGLLGPTTEQRLKNTLKSVISNINKSLRFMQSVMANFDYPIQSNVKAEDKIQLGFRDTAALIHFLVDNDFLGENVLKQITPDVYSKLREFDSMLSRFNSQNFGNKHSFKLDATHPYFNSELWSQYNCNDSFYMSSVGTKGFASLTMPLLQEIVETRVIPFSDQSMIFKYPYIFKTPRGNFASSMPLQQNCSSFYTANDCQPLLNEHCADAFLNGKVNSQCMKDASNYRAANLVTCAGADEPTLVVTVPSSLQVALDCHGNNDFNVTLNPGTSFLLPCSLKSSNGIWNTVSGAVPSDFSSPYASTSPTMKRETDLVLQILIIFVYVVLIIVLVTGSGCAIVWYRSQRRRRIALRNARTTNTPEAPPPYPTQVLYIAPSYAAPAAMGSSPPTSGFVEIVE